MVQGGGERLGECTGDKVRGEVSATYLDYPKAAERAAALVPTVRVVALLREPVARISSSFNMRWQIEVCGKLTWTRPDCFAGITARAVVRDNMVGPWQKAQALKEWLILALHTALAAGLEVPEVNQVELHPWLQQREFRAWMQEAIGHLGGLDFLIANASSLVAGANEEAWRKGMDIDILGTVRVVEEALPHLAASDCGSVTAISSTAAVNILGGVRAYSGVKAALISYMSGLSTNYAANGIRANTVSPGAVYFEGGVWERNKAQDPERYAMAVKRNPMGRFCTPEEVANGAVFLASPAASYISGVNLVVDGAATTRIQY